MYRLLRSFYFILKIMAVWCFSPMVIPRKPGVINYAKSVSILRVFCISMARFILLSGGTIEIVDVALLMLLYYCKAFFTGCFFFHLTCLDKKKKASSLLNRFSAGTETSLRVKEVSFLDCNQSRTSTGRLLQLQTILN